ncbi:MAG: hypothetical protein RLZ75_725 [Pseudomonadota bacterium]
MHIIIVGASIAGLSAAASLRKLGFEKVTVFERLAAPKEARRPRNGGGIGLHDDSMQILSDLGIQFDDYLPMRGQEDRDRTGRIIRQGVIPFSAAYWGDLHRKLLQKSLELGVTIVYGKNVIDVQEQASTVRIIFQDASEVEGDCLIGADGSLSAVRNCIFPGDVLRKYSYLAWRGLVPYAEMETEFRTQVEDKFNLGKLVFEMTERSHAVIYYLPQGLNWLIYVNTTEDIDPTYIERDEVVGNITSTATLEELDAFYKFVDCHYQPVLASIIRKTKAPFKNQIYDINPLDIYSKNRVLLIGDAAHATSPHYLRGSNMAVVDGSCLALAFVKAAIKGEDFHPKEAFANFESQRKEYCNQIVQISRRLGLVKQGVFNKSQSLDWDLTCTTDELNHMLQDGIG